MPTTQLNVTGPFDLNRSRAVRNQKSINLWPDVDAVTKEYYMRPTPGNALVQEINTGTSTDTGRPGGLVEFNNVLYGVIGNKFYRFDANLNPTEEGTLNTNDTPVNIEANENQIMITDDTEGWIYDINTATFTQITSPGFTSNPNSLAYQNTLFIVSIRNTQEWQASAPGNGLLWDVENIGVAEAEPDDLVAVVALNNRLLLFGNDSVETWYEDPNASGSPFPFKRNNNLIFQYGAFNKESIAKSHNSATGSNEGCVFWVSRDKDGFGSVFMSTGAQPVRISDEDIDFIFQEENKRVDLTDIVGTTYREDGHLFYVLTSKNANLTLVYDATVRAWHKRTDHNRNYCPIASLAYFSETGRHYYTTQFDSNLYELSLDRLTDNGLTIPRVREFEPRFENTTIRNIVVDEIELEFQSGEFNPTFPGINQPYAPALLGEQVFCYVSISRDGGQSFGPKRPASVGKIGERKVRTRVRQFGWVQADRLAIRIEMAQKVPYYISYGQMRYRETNR